MKANEMIENFNKLFDENQKVLYGAILEKKDWILNKFFVPYKIENLDEQLVSEFAMFEKEALPFKPLVSNDECDEKLVELFNNEAKLVKLYKKPLVLKGTFWVEYDLRFLRDATYQDLFPNFFFCFNKEELQITTDISMFNAMKLAMVGNNDNEAVIILPNKLVHLGCYNIGCLNKIIINNQDEKQYIEKLKPIAVEKNVTLEVYND